MEKKSPARNAEWGIPDGLDPADYDTVTWDVYRWAWEFARRRTDIRKAYDRHADEIYNRMRAEGYLGPTPKEPAFIIKVPDQNSFGMVGIPNPRIGNQPFLEAIFEPADNYYWVGIGEDIIDTANWQRCFIPKGCIAFVVDPSRPYKKQLDDFLATLLKDFGPSPKTRQNRRLWKLYLMALDADEAGYAYSEILTCIVRQNPMYRVDWTVARDVIDQARQLRDHFQVW
jgi:hypothetical protein